MQQLKNLLNPPIRRSSLQSPLIRHRSTSSSVSDLSYASMAVEWKYKPFNQFYGCLKILGKGAQGVALSLVNLRLPSRPVVAKFYADNEGNRRRITNEIAILKRLNSTGCKQFLLCYQENFVTKLDTLPSSCSSVISSSNGLVLIVVYDYFLGENTVSLSNIMKIQSEEELGRIAAGEIEDDEDDEPLRNPDSLMEIGRTLLKAVYFLHLQKVAHLDLKPQNIIINRVTKRVQLIDFGVSCMSDVCPPEGTLSYMSPEVATSMMNKSQKLTLDLAIKSDSWSLGVILFELMNEASPFTEIELTSPMAVMALREHNIVGSDCQKFARDVSTSIDQMIDGMLNLNPNDRLDVGNCVTLFANATDSPPPSPFI